MKSKKPSIIAAGLALFSMFFGAGNIIFPVLVGEAAGSHLILATVCFSIAAVVFPLLGLLAMLLYDCDIKQFFCRLGKRTGMALYTTLVLLLGPLGSTPRLFNVAYATLEPYLFSIGVPLFSLLTAIAITPFVLRSDRAMRLLGFVLTPVLLASLAVIIIRGVWGASPELVDHHTPTFILFDSLQKGYLLLDLPAALLYAGLVLFYFKHEGDEKEKEHHLVLRRALKASALALVLLCLVYGGLIAVGAYHAAAVGGGGAPEDVLRRVCMSYLGSIGGPIASIAVGLACLTTAISQTLVCTHFLRDHLFKGRGGNFLPLALTLGAAVAMSLIGFSGMMRLLGPILTVLTPALVVLCLANISHRLYRFEPIKLPVVTALIATLAWGGVRLVLS
jgi:branched-chain amino acid:cation transporter, LIVCS family